MPSFQFTEFSLIEKYRKSFSESELGRIYEQLPLKELASKLHSHLPRKSSKGRKSSFPPEGEIALMFLKSYTGLSDDGLIEALNGSIHMQMFCGILIDPSHPIKNGRIVCAIRNRLASVLDIKELQQVLYDKWAPSLSDKDMLMTDATCYESHLRFPTDVKLLWECCDWLHSLMAKTCKNLKIQMPRSKFNDISQARLVLAKQRKPRKKSWTKMLRRLIKLLEKLISQWDSICLEHSICLNSESKKRLDALHDVLSQQRELLEKKETSHRVVSIDRPYIRPIVRGKENKKVEFGAKVNNIQIDGVSFIEHLSFEAFHEGIRLKDCIKYQESLTGVEVKRVGADTIYANNDNRTYCTQKGIMTCFARKGPKPKTEDAEVSETRSMIGRVRATAMEGSFGNQKQHFSLRRVAARNKASEILMIFFGIHTANASTLATRKFIKDQKERQKQKKTA